MPRLQPWWWSVHGSSDDCVGPPDSVISLSFDKASTHTAAASTAVLGTPHRSGGTSSHHTSSNISSPTDMDVDSSTPNKPTVATNATLCIRPSPDRLSHRSGPTSPSQSVACLCQRANDQTPDTKGYLQVGDEA